MRRMKEFTKWPIFENYFNMLRCKYIKRPCEYWRIGDVYARELAGAREQ